MHACHSRAGLLLIVDLQDVHANPTVAVAPSNGADTALSDVAAPTTTAAEALRMMWQQPATHLCSCGGGGGGSRCKILLLLAIISMSYDILGVPMSSHNSTSHNDSCSVM